MAECLRLDPYLKGGEARRRNTYPARCEDCGHIFAPGEAAIEWSTGKGRWVAFHIR